MTLETVYEMTTCWHGFCTYFPHICYVKLTICIELVLGVNNQVSLYCRYTAEEDFLNADAVFDCIGDPPEERFDLAFCGSLLEKQYVS